jgi:hypothetical protein
MGALGRRRCLAPWELRGERSSPAETLNYQGLVPWESPMQVSPVRDGQMYSVSVWEGGEDDPIGLHAKGG